MTGPEVVTIFVYRDSAEIGNTNVYVLHNIWRLGQVRDTKFGMNVSNENLLNSANC